MSTDLAVRDGAHPVHAARRFKPSSKPRPEAATSMHSVIEQRNLYQRHQWPRARPRRRVADMRGDRRRVQPGQRRRRQNRSPAADPQRRAPRPRRSRPPEPAAPARSGRRGKPRATAAAAWESSRRLIRARDRGLKLRVPRRLQGGQGRPRGRMGRRPMHPQREELGDPRRLRPEFDGADPRAIQNIAAAPGVRGQPAGYATTLRRRSSVTAARLTSPRRITTPPPSSTTRRSRRSPRNSSACGPASTGTEFVRKLMEPPDGIPEAAGVAIEAWAWWVGRTPESESGTPEEPARARPQPSEVTP